MSRSYCICLIAILTLVHPGVPQGLLAALTAPPAVAHLHVHPPPLHPPLPPVQGLETKRTSKSKYVQ